MELHEALRMLPGAKSAYGSSTETFLFADLTSDYAIPGSNPVETLPAGTEVQIEKLMPEEGSDAVLINYEPPEHEGFRDEEGKTLILSASLLSNFRGNH